MEIHFETILKKFKNKAAHLANKPYETLRSKHSDLLDEGADELIKLLLGIGGAVDFGETAYMGVGNAADAFDATDTDLQGASKKYVVVDAQPTLEADEKAQWVATFDKEANCIMLQRYRFVLITLAHKLL